MPGMFKLFLLEGINWSLIIIDHEQEDSTYSAVLLR